MANKWTPLMVLLVGAALVIGGCNDKGKPKGTGKPAKPKPKVVGPRDVAVKLLKAMVSGDGAAAAACVDCSEEDKAFIKQVVEVLPDGKMQAFADAGIKAYGKDAWMAAAEETGMQHMAWMPSIAEIEKELECKVEGDKATCTMEGLDVPFVLVKKDGKWLAVLDDLPAKAEHEKELKMTSGTADAVRKVTGKIGKPGVTALQVLYELRMTIPMEPGVEIPKAADPPAPRRGRSAD